MNEDLVALKVTSGWKMCSNTFIDPNNKNIGSIGDYYSEYLLVMTNVYRNRILDVGWYKFNKLQGEFCVIIAELSEGVEQLAYWEGPLFYYKSEDINTMVDTINNLLFEITNGSI